MGENKKKATKATNLYLNDAYEKANVKTQAFHKAQEKFKKAQDLKAKKEFSKYFKKESRLEPLKSNTIAGLQPKPYVKMANKDPIKEEKKIQELAPRKFQDLKEKKFGNPFLETLNAKDSFEKKAYTVQKQYALSAMKTKEKKREKEPQVNTQNINTAEEEQRQKQERKQAKKEKKEAKKVERKEQTNVKSKESRDKN